jgi:GNAT superfamily N-acetyltransferase
MSTGGGALEYRALTLADRAEWARLLALTFDRTPEQMDRLLEWFHAGFQLVTWGAWDGNRLVAQYNCRLLELEVPGQPDRIAAGMGLNMAVHPDYRGRGLLNTVATPVHDEIARRGCVAGVGFSSVGGLAVTRSSASYAYRVLGPMTSTVTLLLRRRDPAGVELSGTWPRGRLDLPPGTGDQVRYAMSGASLRHRFAEHPFRRYVFGAWRDGDVIRGLTVHRAIRLRGLPAVALLGAYGGDQEDLLARWAGTVRAGGRAIVHTVTSPRSTLRTALRKLGPSAVVPISRHRYHLIARALTDDAPAALFELDRWDCSGADIL